MEEQDPQDTAVLSDDMTAPKVEQREVKVSSVYEGLVEIAKAHGKLYRTNGKMSDSIRFDLVSHSVFVRCAFLIRDGNVTMPVLETASVRIGLSGLPWLTQEERDIDPLQLFRSHWLSRPNGSEKFMYSNFKAKDIDEMSDDEMISGEVRSEARVRLEAWLLCASMDGTLESYVRGHDNWRPGSWWLSVPSPCAGEPDFVIKTEWWTRKYRNSWELVDKKSGGYLVVDADNTVVADLGQQLDAMTVRAIKSVPELVRAAKSLAREAFSMQMNAGKYDIDKAVCDMNRVIDYVETGVERNM